MTKPVLKRAIALVKKGKSFGEAAKALGITRNMVAGACHRAGVRGQNASDGSVTRKAVELYEAGVPLKEIAHRLGHSVKSLSYGALYSLLYRAGVKANRQPRA